MFANSGDVLTFLIALSPLVLLAVYFLKSRRRKRIGLALCISVVLVIVLAPVTGLYLGVPLANLVPPLATSPSVGRAAPYMLFAGLGCCVVWVVTTLFGRFGE